jgi:hypothetical protein
MPIAPERTFDPTKPLVVRRFFVAAGRHFNIGDAFDWRRMSVDQRRVRLLFEAGKLTHGPEVSTVTAQVVMPASDLAGLQARESAANAVAEAVTDAEVIALFGGDVPTIEQEMADEDILALAASDGLDDMNMKDLRAIAEKEGAPYRVSREAQREAIRQHRNAMLG